jgi:hypothetical protein
MFVKQSSLLSLSPLKKQKAPEGAHILTSGDGRRLYRTLQVQYTFWLKFLRAQFYFLQKLSTYWISSTQSQ